jgi:putative zinc finger/helix-turn-helix YgiT family protein
MTCFNCGLETLSTGAVDLTGERNGQRFNVRMTGLKCGNCGFQTVDADQGSEFTRVVSDAYRAANGLLTSAEIVSARTQLGMSQQQFAEHLGTGAASVKRWEIGKIQDRSMDELIRLKTDPQAVRKMLRSLEAQVPEQHVLSSSVFEGRSIELSFLLDNQLFERRLPIRMDKSDLPSVTGDDDMPIAA